MLWYGIQMWNVFTCVIFNWQILAYMLKTSNFDDMDENKTEEETENVNRFAIKFLYVMYY